MPFTKISQQEARAYKKEVHELRAKVSAIKYRARLAEHVGKHITNIKAGIVDAWIVHALAKSGQVCVVTPIPGKDEIALYAVTP